MGCTISLVYGEGGGLMMALKSGTQVVHPAEENATFQVDVVPVTLASLAFFPIRNFQRLPFRSPA